MHKGIKCFACHLGQLPLDLTEVAREVPLDKFKIIFHTTMGERTHTYRPPGFRTTFPKHFLQTGDGLHSHNPSVNTIAIPSEDYGWQ